MAARRPPWEYPVFASLTVLGPLFLLWVNGSAIRPIPAALVTFAALLLGLGCGSILAWTLLAAWNAFMLVFMFGAGLAGSPFLVVAPPVAFHAVSLALLFSLGMRRHVGGGPGVSGHPA